MLGKLFKGKSVPSNGGNTPDNLEKLQYVKIFELELSNMEDSPVYPLSHQLSIGSEIGNIIIADPSISPRHATFALQDEVVSLMDHGSVNGTTINGKKIEAGKSIILEESDVVRVGDLEVKIKVGRTSVKAEAIPDLPSEDKKEEAPPTQTKTPKSYIDLPKKEEKSKKAQVVAFKAPTQSTNALMRVIAVVSDLLLSYVILTIFLPFDEFRLVLDAVPQLLAEIDWESLMALTGQDLGFLKEMASDALAFLESTFHLIPILIIFALLRLTTTLIFGVSISELCLGIRPVGNPVWTRVGGVIRVLVGFVTWPFLIFDLPSLVSKRTFKELITITNTQVPSKFIAILGILFYLPLMIILCVVSPLAQGLEFPEAVIVNDQIDKRVKVKVNDPAATAEVTPLSDKSETLHLDLAYNPGELKIIPDFKFHGVKSKLTVRSSLVFYQRDLQSPLEFEVYKTFSMKELLGIGIKGNVFLYEKYPEIYNFVYEPDDLNMSFRKSQNPKAEMKFANEVIMFTKSSFGLSIENVVDFMQTETPLIKGLMDFRSSLMGLVEYKDFDQIGFLKIGNIVFMRISYNKQKPFDLLIPLIRGPGRIFKVTFPKKENAGASSSKFYKFNLEKSNWLPEGKSEAGEVMTALQVFDLFTGDNFKTLLQSTGRPQALYGYYYETSADVLKKGDPVEKEIWKSKVQNLLNLLEKLPEQPVSPEEGNPKEKLIQNFRDTLDALEHNNFEYFGVTQNTSI